MSKIERCAVKVTGTGETALVFLHGYGCDSSMWRKVAPAFESRFKVITYDLMGYGQSAIEHYDRARYSTLDGHAEDLIDILDELDLSDVIAVGHSVSAMTVALAANRRPDLIAKTVMICPSPSYMNDEAYTGGFEESDLLGLLDILEVNYLGWAADMAPAIMGAPDRPGLGDKLTESFCQTDPDIAKHFARVTFLSDHREDVKKIAQPTLVLQCRDDILVPDTVRAWFDANLQRGEQVLLDATGHCPHMSFPEQTIAAISAFLKPAPLR
ncbi:alpha/beta fold hydrolase [Neptunicoccus cionae]|uniref:alpha/beta fold hydrolase n=1 Tax=Neptunicoccus cionae TaxID=2035344 RepID=UPI000C75C6B8|nr:alpha/beta hydrolase [Amylibacter cionae]PLS22628.1 alpha/beta hydrolase [Amylibacter cionae]